MIFNIQKCSIHDGNGLRTLVFFKGCPMKCLWCANPESQSYKAEIMESPSRCIDCGECARVCPEGAIKRDAEGYLRINRDACTDCFKCTDVCYAGSKFISGKDYSVEELYKEIQKDRKFYTLYGGGVTFSGGEPLTYGAYLTKIAKKCQENGINVAIESCGYAKYEDFESALPYIDSMFMDIKHIDKEKHKELTGKGNELILENIRCIAEYGIPITVRTPVIPGYNDTLENIIGIAKFIADVPGIQAYELLPYHNFGESKYKALGMEYGLKDVSAPEDEGVRKLVKSANEILKQHGKTCFYVKDNEKEIVI